MVTLRHTRHNHRRTVSVLALGILVLVVGCAGPRVGRAPAGVPGPAPTGTVALMGPSRLSGAQLTAWFLGRQPQPGGAYAATVPVSALAQAYVDEGAAEGVAGDVAFVQGIVETGWYRFGGSVPGWKNNFAGIGATDTNPAPAVFPDARTGIRAQIQHLRAYGDAGATACTIPPLHNPCVDPRFALVVPKGKAPTWNQMGNGNWATSTTYSSTILRLYNEALAFNGLPPA